MANNINLDNNFNDLNNNNDNDLNSSFVSEVSTDNINLNFGEE